MKKNHLPRNLHRYSYTLYDKLGRITTVGEKTGVADLATVDTKDDQALSGWLAAGTNKQVTKTLYDDPVNLTFQTMGNSRKRVVASVFLENESDLEGDSTLYAYDLSGNVKTLVQHVKALLANDPDNGKKRVDYDYDLISGKVNKLTYQKGRGDQFFYQYGYDAENRLTSAQTSRDGLVWTQDATYRYYLHGPLARTELGHYKVQGVDYAYTLQGWLRGINSDTLNSAKEIGGDGEPNTLFSKVSKDVYAFTLGYYGGDYTPIGGTAAPAFGLVPYSAPSSLAATGNSLYNGNISYTTVALSKINNGATAGYTYGYDQLNRLREMRQHTVNGAWSNSNIIDAYSESIAYDANGNILQYLRKGANTAGQPLDMDSLTYKYNRDADGRLLTNRLNHVRDAVSSSNYTIDIDDQSPDNYAYDKIGNLTKDNAEHISGINWTVYGKIKNITKGGSTASQINYGYDAGGNRTLKTVGAGEALKKTFYIRDAQGNVLAVYTRKNSEAVKWEEQHLYGSSRLGMWQWDTLVPATAPLVQSDGQPIFDSLLLGSRTYELSNHLGNVLVTISDKKIGVSSPQDSSLIEHYRAEVTTAQDYYPFGMKLPGRSGALSASGLWQDGGSSNALPANPVYDSRTGNEPLEYKATETISFVEGFESGVNDAFEAYITTDNGSGSGGNGGSAAGLYADGGYRYGFNGKENDNEVKGEGAQQDYGMRIYDPRLGRFLSVDPLSKSYPWNSPYSFAEGDVLRSIDLDGLEKYVIHQRSFAPWQFFGEINLGPAGHYKYTGDNRGFTVSTAASVHSKVATAITVDLSTSKAFILDAKQHGNTVRYDARTNKPIGEPAPNVVPEVDLYSPQKSGSQTTIKAKMEGKAPFAPVPGLDWAKSVVNQPIVWTGTTTIDNHITDRDSHINVSYNYLGKGFPALEAFIEDAKGTKLFIGAYVSPPKSKIIQVLSGSELAVSKTMNIKIATDKEGNFYGVYWRNEKGTEVVMKPSAYNQQFSNTPPAFDLPEKKKP